MEQCPRVCPGSVGAKSESGNGTDGASSRGGGGAWPGSAAGGTFAHFSTARSCESAADPVAAADSGTAAPIQLSPIHAVVVSRGAAESAE